MVGTEDFGKYSREERLQANIDPNGGSQEYGGEQRYVVRPGMGKKPSTKYVFQLLKKKTHP